ncbi:hypothetical protein N7448_011170 [Penicillium atrosanguineum]|nr:hypothetical protein N7448_011170 [Penicillium atrosanguineum]
MERFMFTDTELQLATERELKYQGTAKLDLSHISCHPSTARQLDQKNVERLCEVFRNDGCYRLDVQNHVTAVVTRRHLKRARRAARITADELLSNPPEKYPSLSFSSGQVRCLHGQHRLKAAEETLAPSERWWTVDLYLDDISHDLQNTLIDEYANEKVPSDGEIYRKLRQYENEHNAPFQKRWWARLSDNKAKRLRQLLKTVDIRTAFDALLPIPGLWDGMSIGSLNHVMALRCDEEIIHYLQHVKRFWSTLVDGNRDQMAKIDLHTVKALQLKAPAACSKDSRAVKGLILSGEVFSHFTETERHTIWDKMATRDACDSIIPSLHTFFRDIYYLEACASGMKRFVEFGRSTRTVRTAMKNIFRIEEPTETCPVQTSEATFRSYAGPRSDFFELAYRQLWLFMMRHYTQLARKPTSKKVVAKANSSKADEVVLYDMAALARKLGFNSVPATDLLSLSPDRHIAREALLKARKPGSYRYNLNSFESLIDRVVECFASAVAHEALPPSPLILGVPPTVESRCGLPRQDLQAVDRALLFLDRMHAKNTPSSNVVSSFYVRQCVYFAFFGKPANDEIHQIHNRGDHPQSPLFVPADDLLMPSPRPSTQLATPSRRQGRRERQGQRRDGRGQVHCEGQIEVARNGETSIPARLDAFSADQDTTMDDLFQVRSEGEIMEPVRSPTEIDFGEENDLQLDSDHDLGGSSDADSEILPDVEHEEPEQQFSTYLPETKSIIVLGDSEYESSLLSESEGVNIHEETETLPPRKSSYQHSNPVVTTQNSAESEKTEERPLISETQVELTRGEFPANHPQQSERTLTQFDQDNLERRVEERDAAEDALQETLENLEHEAEARALTAHLEHVPGKQTVLRDQQAFQSDINEPTLAQAEGEELVPTERPAVSISNSEQLIRQGRMARTVRAAKVVTQFDIAGQRIADTTEQGESTHEEAIESPTIRSDKTTANIEPLGSSAHHRKDNEKKPRVHQGDLNEGIAPDDIGGFIIPPLPEELHPLRILPPNTVTITFRAYENGRWHTTDEVQVDPTDPSEAQRIAYKYTRKDGQHTQFYNKKLRLVSAAQCVRAAMDDGSNTILMSLRQELKVTQDKVAEVAEMFNVDDENQDSDDGIF